MSQTLASWLLALISRCGRDGHFIGTVDGRWERRGGRLIGLLLMDEFVLWCIGYMAGENYAGPKDLLVTAYL